jgi:hypothetical protein
MYEALLTGVIIYETRKRTTIYALKAGWTSTEAAIAAFSTEWDKWFPEAEPACDASIMCLRDGKRHKKDCPLNRNYRQSCPKDTHFSCASVHKDSQYA